MAKSLNDAAGNKKTKVAEVVRFGDKITVPDGMTLAEAIFNIESKMVEEEQVVNMTETFSVYVWEGAYALAKALDEKYGFFQQKATPGFFGSTPPSLISVAISLTETVQVPWGRFSVPGIPADDGFMSTGFEAKDNGFIAFRLTASLKKKHSSQFHDLCVAIREQLKTYSLYRGKAVTIKFRDEDGDRVEMPHPQFQAISKIDPESMVFNRDLEALIEANIFTPIARTQEVREAGIPLKRGVLLEGSYGTGKTLTATATAQLATQNGWTYFYCQSAAEFADVVRFAQQYQPAVIFCEDIDKAIKGERTALMDEILNIVDGLDSKSNELMIVLTTNEVESINEAMLRPGRLDAVISYQRPDAEAVGRLLRYYAQGRLAKDETLDQIGIKLAGNTPAVIREVVERSKLAALAVNKPGDAVTLTEKALLLSAAGMKNQLTLLNKTKEKKLTAIETYSNIIGFHLADGMKKAATAGNKAAPEAADAIQELPDFQAISALEAASSFAQ